MGRFPILLGALLVLGPAGGGAAVANLGLSHLSGFYESAFTLTIPVPAGAATVYYTTNGLFPRPESATPYTRPIPIATTTIVRAAGFDRETNLISTTTRTFLFVSDVLGQTGAHLPKTWGTNHAKPARAHYAMITSKSENAASRQRVAEGLRSLATLSIIAEPDDLFSAESGLYAHPTERGAAWERRVLVELIDTNNRPLFQCGAGLRLHGSMSRRPDESPKHSFRLNFRSRYGAAKLRYPMFGEHGAQEFDTLILRAGNNNSWLDSSGEGRRRADYIRDEWMRRSMLAMGHPSARGIFVHFYLNGLYWWLYNLCEPPDESLFADDGDISGAKFDVRKAGKTESGDEIAWTQMMNLANAGLTGERNFAEMGQLLDLPEFVDYLILNSYAGNSDWDRTANWVAARPRIPGGRFQFLVWDAERTLEDLDADTLDFDDQDSPQRLFHQLCENAAFRKLFASRSRQLLFDRGPLSPENCADHYGALTNVVAKALTAEAARWGTYRRDVHQYKSGPFEGYTVEGHWQPEVDRILNEYFPRRREIVLSQFRERGLFPPNHDAARWTH